jgi:hypothetical protein
MDCLDLLEAAFIPPTSGTAKLYPELEIGKH